jgi:hypothetical protein
MFRILTGVNSEKCLSCEVVQCAACRKHVEASLFKKKELENHFVRSDKLVCQECRAAGCTAKNPERYQCTTASCGKLCGCKSFDAKQLEHFKDRGGVLTCVQCRASFKQQLDNDQQEERTLRAKAKRSKRKGCVCQRLAGHAEKCPMHIYYFGEMPYPWCDVMTRDESEWLRDRSDSKKARRS